MENALPVKKQRLNFIDMARSVAILLMLEGHFVDFLLSDAYRDLSNPIFSTWLFIRGFTAPIFLTVTGLVFVYLLLNNRNEPYFKNIRIKKGFKRALELVFWGFLLQYYAFHVLECIAVGILTILSVFGIYKLVKIIPLWIYFFALGMVIFGLDIYFESLAEGELWPGIKPKFLNYPFHGPIQNSLFPVIPWMGYTMFGAMIGCLLQDFNKHIKKWITPMISVSIGLILFFGSKSFLLWLDPILGHPFVENIACIDYLFERIGMVLIALSVLLMIEKLIGDIKPNLFLKIGQNTLTIYILHMIVLYGSISRIGVSKFLEHKSLGPWQVTIGAIIFMSFFVLIIYKLDEIKEKLEFILGPIRRFFNKIYNIS